MNHEKTIVKLAKGLSLIADRLPQVELLLSLYPTDRMRMAVAMLNAHVMRFLIRAHDWYLEGAWKHAVHSLTRPYKLRYEDLLDAIAVSTSTIRELASCEEQVNIDTLRKDVVQVNMKLGNMDSKLENMAMAITRKLKYLLCHETASKMTKNCLQSRYRRTPKPPTCSSPKS